MNRRSIGTLFLSSLACAALMAPAAAQSASSPSAAQAAAAAVKALEAQRPHAPQPYESFSRGAAVQGGLISVVKKDGKVYLSLAPAQVGKDFIETAVPSTGLGGFGPAQGEPYVAPARLVRFERVDDNIVIRWPNTDAIALPNTPENAGTTQSLPSSVVAVVPVVAEDGGHVVFSADSFLGDVADFAEQLRPDRNPMHAYRLDPSRSFFSAAKAFAENDVLRVDQTWAAPEQTPIDNVPDARSVEVTITYNLIAAPADGYVPRIYDPRVGYFSQPLIDFSSDSLLRRDVHYITRWNFGSRTSSAPFHATNPLVFYLSNDIPTQYRETVRQALLTWNSAFARAGILNAVQVLNQPSDPSWDPDDIRHNMIRWIDTSRPQFGAEALLLCDPRTGEELNVGVNFDAVEGMGGRLTYKYKIAPARGLADSAQAEKYYAEGFIRSVILHESGHDLGLQHNFIASEAYTAKQLQNKSFTSTHGIANSVMEYSPTNLWPKGTPQGDYDQLVLGPYDYYAVQYGYGYIPAHSPQQELPTLRRWASRWSDPNYRFASDEDAGAFAFGHSTDPRVVMFDLTNKPLQWCDTQMAMDHQLMDNVNRRFPERGMAYDEARAAFLMPMRGYLQCAAYPAHTIGGEYISRALRGDAGAGLPLTPVSRGDEVAAWKDLQTHLFSDSAWNFNPAVLQTLTYSEVSSLSLDATWSYAPSLTHDVPVVTMVGAAQQATLNELFSPLRMVNLDAMNTKYAPGRTMSLSDLFDWAQSGIFGDLSNGGSKDGLIRRNLQVTYAKMLASMWTAPRPGTPADAQALARLELDNLRHDAVVGQGRHGLNSMQRAHLASLQAIAEQALQAHATIAAPVAGGF